MRKAKEKEVKEATKPMRIVPTAPPRGDIIRNDEAVFTSEGVCAIVRANMVGNIMASNA